MLMKFQKPLVIGFLFVLISCGSFGYQFYSASTSLFIYFEIPKSYLDLDGRAVSQQLKEDKRILFGGCENFSPEIENGQISYGKDRGSSFQTLTSFVLLFNDKSWDHGCIKNHIHKNSLKPKNKVFNGDTLGLLRSAKKLSETKVCSLEKGLSQSKLILEISDNLKIEDILARFELSNNWGKSDVLTAFDLDEFCLASRSGAAVVFVRDGAILINQSAAESLISISNAEIERLSFQHIFRLKERPQAEPRPILVLLTTAFFIIGCLLIVGSKNEKSS